MRYKLSDVILEYYHEGTGITHKGHLQYIDEDSDFLEFKYAGGVISLPDLNNITIIISEENENAS